jgi:hypothetical protein
MNKYIIVTCLFLSMVVSLGQASETRMATLLAGDYLDDIVNIGVFPHHIILYYNSLYGDIKQEIEDYGIIFTPDMKYGALGIWQYGMTNGKFNIGYAINILRFSCGAFVSPTKDHFQFGIGLGRSFFNRRIDLSFLVNDERNNEWYLFTLRFSQRKADLIIIPRYRLNYLRTPYEYSNHRIGLMVQRLVLNDGFVFLGAEYELNRGDISSNHTNIYAGCELTLNRTFILRLGITENFTDGFNTPQWQVAPGIGLQIKGFNIDLHLNRNWLYDKDVTPFNSFGLDLNFSRF